MHQTTGTILDLCVRQAGGQVSDVPGAARVCEFVVAWAMASQKHGGPIKVEGTPGSFRAYWGSGFSRRAVYYRLSEFRQLFPELDTPQPLADLLIEATAKGEAPGPLTVVAA
jgi:hypothetical protein